MDEHIQIPKSILKQFSTVSHATNDDGKPIKQSITYVLDVDGNIYPQDIKDCNIKKGYYNIDCEQHIARCETAFGDLKTKILQGVKQGIHFSFGSEDIEIIKKFYKMCFSRSPVFQNELVSNLDKIFPGISFRKLQKNLFIEDPPSISDIDNKNNVRIIINETNLNYVIPQFCWYYIGRGQNEILFMPISPKVGLALNHKKKKTFSSFYRNAKPDYIDALNRVAIFSEFNANRQFVYAINADDLKRYLPFVEVIRNEIQI